jgi:hypothetical protein
MCCMRLRLGRELARLRSWGCSVRAEVWSMWRVQRKVVGLEAEQVLRKGELGGLTC